MFAQSLKPMLLAAAMLVASGGALMAPTAAQAQASIAVQIGPPPAPRVEVVPQPVAGRVWAPGHYEWVHGNYIWRRGHWLAARPGYVYVAPTWVADGPRWVYRPARWDAGPAPVVRPRRWRDRDHDGVPNRYDRRPNNPYRY